ncbi:1-phosphatidylinositol 4,5-bisphosphate phosphodiesterase zeta-1 isoform X2 [Nematostella vectensis]|uniref:1-phosphatidylinositol 4,5-bisphosphate phosphodiesterase zeta-1 isoform X2 n=1 Tax=Nematostella vectensis TaxID=45351 RepID=UPI00207793AF|nr:1-phosphatidylinositol 4,5-bisphosphate phosphodiesterase zeta-1 isoform X2 [Nematostella vectensis]
MLLFVMTATGLCVSLGPSNTQWSYKHSHVMSVSSGSQTSVKFFKGIQRWRLDSELDSSVPQGLDDVAASEKNAQDRESKILMYPTLSKPQAKEWIVFSAANEVHQEFAMIKYARGGKAIPHERVFRLDNENLHIMWKKRGKIHGFNFRNSLSLDRVVEVRCGQQTRNFVKFPYTEVEHQSFSLIFEKEQGEWGQLCSLDLICDSPKAFVKWKNALEEIIYGEDSRLNRQRYIAVDPVILWLKRHWSILVARHAKSITTDQVFTFANHCWPEGRGKRRQLKTHIRNVLETQCGMNHEERLVFNSFLMLFDSLNEQARLLSVYATYARSYPHLGLSPEEFQAFLAKEQKESLSLAMCAKLIYAHDKLHTMFKRKCAGNDPDAFKRSKHFLSLHGFISFLRSQDNSIVKPEHNKVYQDMDQPLSDYFINSSHNTYLTGHQLKGLSSLEAYVRALLQGCRCIELDIWDGPDEPIITHGRTLTSKIRFRDVVQIIKEYAFEVSEYPLILSLENHCNIQQQAQMAEIFLKDFGDMLVTQDFCRGNVLPSPNALKRRIILKGKIRIKKKIKRAPPGVWSPQGASTKQRKQAKWSVSDYKLSNVDSTPSLHSLNSPNELSNVPSNLQQEEQLNVVPLEDAMDQLIVYCRAVPYRKRDATDNCCEMYSFNDSSAADLITARPRDMVHLCRKHLVRVYPKGSRVDSSNYDPQAAWNAGMQMVSLNFQKPDFAMHLNQGKFRINGGCGYVLKPETLRTFQARSNNYYPMIKESPPGGKSCYFTIEVLSGQYLHIEDGCPLPVRVEIDTVGIPVDCGTFATEIRFEKLNPQWNNAKHQFKLAMPELCLVYFKVLSVQRNKSKLLFQNVISLESIREGVRYVPFRTPTGVLVSHSGLFVKIRVKEFAQASWKVKGTSRERLLTM